MTGFLRALRGSRYNFARDCINTFAPMESCVPVPLTARTHNIGSWLDIAAPDAFARASDDSRTVSTPLLVRFLTS